MSELHLEKLNGYTDFPGPLLLIIMDGVGIGPEDESNGVYMAYTPTLDSLKGNALYTELKAHGTAVGMPSDDDMGNSEVGHNALGAGRVFAQGASRVNDAIADGGIFEGDAWKQVGDKAKDGGTVHFIGLLSDGYVHSHIDHLFAMLKQCDAQGIERVRCHILLDGRDVGGTSALEYVEPLEAALATYNKSGRNYRIASGGGRMITTMDRYDADWTIVERGWKAHVLGDAPGFASATEAIEAARAAEPGIIDQYLPAFVVEEDGKPIGTIEDGDAVILLNYRGDRAIELSRAFDEEDMSEFDRVRVPDVFYAGMMQYDGDAHIPKNFLVEPPSIDRPVSHYMCDNGVSAFAISETQKYGHVTYFWNGNKAGYIDEGIEKYVEIRSDLVPFDQRPFMKGGEITDELIGAIKSGDFKFVRANYPHGDMVGHTGVPLAVRISVETVDLCLSRLLPVLKKAKGMAIITADHGNADCMWTEKDGKRSPHVAHTLNPVPFHIVDYSEANAWKMKEGIDTPGLANVAATMLNLLGYVAPEDYNESLVELG